MMCTCGAWWGVIPPDPCPIHSSPMPAVTGNWTTTYTTATFDPAPPLTGWRCQAERMLLAALGWVRR